MSVKKEGGRIFIFLEDIRRFFYVRRSEFQKIVSAPLSEITSATIKPFLEF